MKDMLISFRALETYISAITGKKITTEINQEIADALRISVKSVENFGKKKFPPYEECIVIVDRLWSMASKSEGLNPKVLYELIYDFLSSSTKDTDYVDIYFKKRSVMFPMHRDTDAAAPPAPPGIHSDADKPQTKEIISNKHITNISALLKREKLCSEFYSSVEACHVVMMVGRCGSGKSSFIKRIVMNDRELHHKYDTFFFFEGSDLDYGNMLSVMIYSLKKQNTANMGDEQKEIITANSMNMHRNFLAIDDIENCDRYTLEKFFSFYCKIRESTDLLIISEKKDKTILAILKKYGLKWNELKMPSKLEKKEWLELAQYFSTYNSNIRMALEADPMLAEWIYSLGCHEPEGLRLNLNYVANKIARGGRLDLIKKNFEANLDSIVIDEKRIQKVLSPLSENEKKVIAAAFLIGRPATYSEIFELTGIMGIDESLGPIENSELDRAVQECKDKLILESDWDNALNENVLSLPQYYKPYIQNKLHLNNPVFKGIIMAWINFHIAKTKEIGMCFDKIYLLKKYDSDARNGNVNIDGIRSVMRFCENNELWDEYYQISYNTRYYFYIRGLSGSGENNVHIKRASAARHINDPNRECEALLYYANICCKRKETGDIEDLFARIKQLIVQNTIDDIHVLKFYYVKGLYYFSVNRFNDANDMFDKYLELARSGEMHINKSDEKMFTYDLSTTKRWKCDCLCHIIENDHSKLDKYLGVIEETALEVEHESKKLNFTRALVHSKLIRARILNITNDNGSEKQVVINELKDYEKIINKDSYYSIQFNKIIQGCAK